MLYVPTPPNATASVVSGQFLARNRLDKRQRAKLAADIGNGKVIVGGFTAKQLAARRFPTSPRRATVGR